MQIIREPMEQTTLHISEHRTYAMGAPITNVCEEI